MTHGPLWTSQAMANAMHAMPSGPLPEAVSGISIDTRSIAPGEAFFAITGDERDGHDFVVAALEAGAGVAVVEIGKRTHFAKDAPLLLVPDVLAALRELARAARARSQARVGATARAMGELPALRVGHPGRHRRDLLGPLQRR